MTKPEPRPTEEKHDIGNPELRQFVNEIYCIGCEQLMHDLDQALPVRVNEYIHRKCA